MSNVIALRKADPVATCPQCKGQQWFINVNGFYNEYDKVTSHECCECGWTLIVDVEVVRC